MLLEARNITKYYDSILACHEICLSLGEGQVFGLLGPNGAGKSTLVKIMLGLVHPSSGEAVIKGRPVSEVKNRKNIGYLPELFRLYGWLTAYEWLRFNARVYDIPANQERQAIERTLELVGLKGREKEKVEGYSKGMQQRLALGAALIHRPVLVFLDEPTSALDPVGRIEVRDIISQLKAEGTSVFLNSHLLSEVEMTCSHLGFIRKGKMVASGKIEDFMQESHEIQIEAEGVPAELLQRWEKQGRLLQRNGSNFNLLIDHRQEIPEIIDELKGCKTRVYRVDTVKGGLEQVFLDLMK
ncbi:ABC transporter ATP-binding protein [Syntrophomonas palmitatica]|uniref:ABC transporter ATP-binding protein n=1 Tax=Syntrophomonas palmitatica TaxID=402877 RepID=UPI0006CF6AF1|nr:ABC transporter ATP-binding protein [Syntrophomonas palmitatica]